MTSCLAVSARPAVGLRTIALATGLALLVGSQSVSPAKGDDEVDKPNIGAAIGKGEAAVHKPCFAVDFDSAELVRADDKLLLRVRGMAPHPGMSIEVRPVQYVMQPEYWLMALVACAAPGAELDGAPVPFATDIPVGGSAGRKGIELSGKPGTKAKRLDLPA